MKNLINKKYLAVIAFTIILSGCSSVGSFIAVQRDETHSVRSFNSQYEKTWNVLKSVITAQDNETIVSDNRQKGVILTGYDEITVSSLRHIGKMPLNRISGGYGQNWLYARKKIDYSVIKISENKTKVKMVIYLQGFNASGKRWINIAPNGVRENEIFDMLKEVLNRS